MIISKITLKDFKTYKDTVEIKFSGKFNVIVGENNIGKSCHLRHCCYGRNVTMKA